LIAGQVYKHDSIFGQAMEIGEMEMSSFSHTEIDRIIEKLGSMAAQQVQAVAKKILRRRPADCCNAGSAAAVREKNRRRCGTE
jgi:predicted Zn-dependent peptidase